MSMRVIVFVKATQNSEAGAPPSQELILEIRPVYELEDFGEALTPELRERQDAMTEQLAKQTAK
jgi:hypothetical protein